MHRAATPSKEPVMVPVVVVLLPVVSVVPAVLVVPVVLVLVCLQWVVVMAFPQAKEAAAFPHRSPLSKSTRACWPP